MKYVKKKGEKERESLNEKIVAKLTQNVQSAIYFFKKLLSLTKNFKKTIRFHFLKKDTCKIRDFTIKNYLREIIRMLQY